MAWKKIPETGRYVASQPRWRQELRILVHLVADTFRSSLQEDMEASLESLQNIDMMDVNVLEETEVENSGAPDFGEDGADSILESLCESKDYVAVQLRELPAQFTGHSVGNADAVQRAAALGLLAAYVLFVRARVRSWITSHHKQTLNSVSKPWGKLYPFKLHIGQMLINE